MKQILCALMIINVIISTSLSAKITDIRNLTGWHKCFAQNSSFLSPLNGFVWLETQLTEKYARFGDIKVEWGTGRQGQRDIPVIKKITEGDATLRLPHDFFHILGQEFNPIQHSEDREKVSPADYFNAKSIGKIISFMYIKCLQSHQERVTEEEIQLCEGLHKDFEQIQQKIQKLELTSQEDEKKLSKLQDFKTKSLGLGVPDLAYRIEKLETINLNNPILKENKELKQIVESIRENLKRRENNSRLEHLKKYGTLKLSSELANIIEHEIPSGDQAHLKKARQNAKGVAQNIIISLKECADLKSVDSGEQKYPNFTTFFILLSFLYAKAGHTDEFKEYCHQLPHEVLRENWEDIIRSQPAEKDIPIGIIDTTSKIDEFLAKAENAKGISFIKDNYEEICINEIFYKNPLPQFFDELSRTVVADTLYVACSEMTALNLVQFLLTKIGIYNKMNNSFNAQGVFDTIKRMLTDKSIAFDEQKVRQGTGRLASFLEILNQGIRTQNKSKTVDAFCELISNVPGVVYLQHFNQKNKEYQKDVLKPFVHALNDSTKPAFAQNVDDSFYLFELSGYPENFLVLINYLFGLELKNLGELTNFFDIRLDINLQDLTNEAIYENMKQKRPPKKFDILASINMVPLKLTMQVSTRHSSLSNPIAYDKKNIPQYFFRYLYENFARDYIFPNILALYTTYFIADSFEYRYNSFKYMKIPPFYIKHFCFTQNLFDETTRIDMVGSLWEKTLESPLLKKYLSHVLDAEMAQNREQIASKLLTKFCRNIQETKSPLIQHKDLLNKFLLLCSQIKSAEEMGSLLPDLIKLLNYLDLGELEEQKNVVLRTTDVFIGQAQENIFTSFQYLVDSLIQIKNEYTKSKLVSEVLKAFIVNIDKIQKDEDEFIPKKFDFYMSALILALSIDPDIPDELDKIKDGFIQLLKTKNVNNLANVFNEMLGKLGRLQDYKLIDSSQKNFTLEFFIEEIFRHILTVEYIKQSGNTDLVNATIDFYKKVMPFITKHFNKENQDRTRYFMSTMTEEARSRFGNDFVDKLEKDLASEIRLLD